MINFLCEYKSIYYIEAYLYVIVIVEFGIELVLYMTGIEWK